MKLAFTRKLGFHKVARTTQYVYVCMTCGYKTTIASSRCTKCGGGTTKLHVKPKSFWSKVFAKLNLLA